MLTDKSQAAATARARAPKRRAVAEKPVVMTKTRYCSWSEGAALFSPGHWPTSDGRIL
jgi:hypothetical protein